MRKISALFCLVLIGVLQVGAQTLTVYPGDANASHRCNHVDLLQLGQSFDLTGPPRNTIDSTWNPFPAFQWAGAPALINAAHSDCNGDGVVDRFDAAVIERNFGEIWGGFFLADDSSNGSPTDPQLRVNMVQDSVTVQGTTTMTMSLDLGTASNPVDSIYGLAVTISYDPLIVDTITIAWTGGFLQDTTNSALLMSRINETDGEIYLAVTGIDHTNRMGYGTLGTIGIVMDDNIRITGQWELMFQVTHVLGLTANAGLVNLHPQGDTLTVLTAMDQPSQTEISVYPNPAVDQFLVQSNLSPITTLRLLDPQGRLIAEQLNLHSQEEIIETDRLAPGCYFLEVHTASGMLRKKLIVQSY